MKDLLVWSLENARQQTLNLVADLRDEQLRECSAAKGNPPAWILGHLLLGDNYLLSLLKVREISADFADLLNKYGPHSNSALGNFDTKKFLIEKLTETNALRLGAVRKLENFAAPLPDETLSRTQPTIAHHLQMLVFHEGHHCGQLASWRKSHGFSPIKGIFAS